MPRTVDAIRALVIFSVLLGVVFLYQVYGVLPPAVFDVIAFGWVMFVVDAVLLSVRPRVAYPLAFVLAVLALASSLPQAAHYAFIEAGEVLPSLTFVLGSAAQVLLVILVPLNAIQGRRRGREFGLVQGQQPDGSRGVVFGRRPVPKGRAGPREARRS